MFVRGRVSVCVWVWVIKQFSEFCQLSRVFSRVTGFYNWKINISQDREIFTIITLWQCQKSHGSKACEEQTQQRRRRSRGQKLPWKECRGQREVGVVLHPFSFVASCPISGHKGTLQQCDLATCCWQNMWLNCRLQRIRHLDRTL